MMFAWMRLLLLPTVVLQAVPSLWPGWALMWALAFTIYCGCKWLSWWHTTVRKVPILRHLAYLLAWPGLDAATFLNPHAKPKKPAARQWLFAACKMLLGIGLLYGVARLIPEQAPYLIGWIGMVGIVMILHFGAFHLLSCWWRAVGIEARPLMNWPLTATSVSEFWGRRWNTAFRDLTHRFLFRPLTGRLGPRWAILAGFLFSGVVHDLVISVPARGGYGGPTAFFAIQGLAMLVERSPLGQQMGLGHGWPGWLFTMLVLLSPVPLLFHPPFVVGVVVPFMQAIGVR